MVTGRVITLVAATNNLSWQDPSVGQEVMALRFHKMKVDWFEGTDKPGKEFDL
jgi:hypothetical protein